MPAKRIYQVKLLTKRRRPGHGGGGGCVYGVNVRDIYLFLVSTFKSKGPHQRLTLLPGHPPGAWLAFGPAPLPAPPAPHPSPPPSGPEPCVSGGGFRECIYLLNYSPFHVTEQFQRCHILLFGDP